MTRDCEYRVWVTDDVRKDEPIVVLMTVKADSSSEALEKVIRSSPPYTGVCLA